MKKLCKNALAVLLLSAVVLCFAGCGGGAGGNPSGPIEYSLDHTWWYAYDDFVCIDLIAKNTQSVSFKVSYDSAKDKYYIHWVWYADDTGDDDFFSHCYIEGIDYDYTSCFSIGTMYFVENSSYTRYVSKEEVLTLLPESGSIVLCMDSDDDSSRNMIWRIPAQYTPKIRAWIENPHAD